MVVLPGGLAEGLAKLAVFHATKSSGTTRLRLMGTVGRLKTKQAVSRSFQFCFEVDLLDSARPGAESRNDWSGGKMFHGLISVGCVDRAANGASQAWIGVDEAGGKDDEALGGRGVEHRGGWRGRKGARPRNKKQGESAVPALACHIILS